jgi:hypothetical protein
MKKFTQLTSPLEFGGSVNRRLDLVPVLFRLVEMSRREEDV